MACCFRVAKLIGAISRPRRRSNGTRGATSGIAVLLVFGVIFGLYEAPALAQGFIEMLFGGGGYGYRSYEEPVYRRASRWAPRHHLSRHREGTLRKRRVIRRRARDPVQDVTAQRRTPTPIAAESPPPVGRRLVCVRMCDAYAFPIVDPGDKIDVSTTETTCRRLCPRAETRLYVLPSASDKIEKAVAVRDGALYSELAERAQAKEHEQPEERRRDSCFCRESSEADEPLAVYSDLTLRPGDIVVTKRGLRVFRGASHFPFGKNDFRPFAQTRGLTRQLRGALSAIESATRRPQTQGNYTIARGRPESPANDLGQTSDASMRPKALSHK
jgi:hypothetical protein